MISVGFTLINVDVTLTSVGITLINVGINWTSQLHFGIVRTTGDDEAWYWPTSVTNSHSMGWVGEMTSEMIDWGYRLHLTKSQPSLILILHVKCHEKLGNMCAFLPLPTFMRFMAKIDRFLPAGKGSGSFLYTEQTWLEIVRHWLMAEWATLPK